MKIASHAWLEIAHGKIYLFFKTIKNIEIADLALTIKSFYD